MSGSIVKREHALEMCFGEMETVCVLATCLGETRRRSAFVTQAERRGDVQCFGPQAFESRSLRRFIDAGFSFHIRTVGVLRCAHTNRESFVLFCLCHGPTDRVQCHTDYNVLFLEWTYYRKQTIEMDTGQWHIGWAVLV